MSAIFRDQLLAGKTAFLTGSSSGIGLGIAECFAAQGARVVLNGRNPEKLDAAVAGITAQGGLAHAECCDVRDYAAVEAALKRTHDAYGEIDILLCGAAGNFPAPVTGISANGFKAVIDIDLLGTFHACRASFAYLRKPGASVLAISANHASVAYALQAHVCAAKAGIERLLQVLALEWGPLGIRSNLINPGPIDDTEGMRRLAPTPEAREEAIRSVPLLRLGTKQDVANLALFLVSDAASYLNGGVFHCDGGQALLGARAMGMGRV
jgi:NAD(P)-dependent dehydrogenase (short-subunit alcohol dehydrogenase family)